MKIIDVKTLSNKYYSKFYSKSLILPELFIAIINCVMILPLSKIFLYILSSSKSSINIIGEVFWFALLFIIFLILYMGCYSFIEKEKNKFSEQDRLKYICSIFKESENLFYQKNCIQFLINKLSEKEEDIDKKHIKYILHILFEIAKFLIPLIVTISFGNISAKATSDLEIKSLTALIIVFTIVAITSIIMTIVTLKCFEEINKLYSYEKSKSELKDNLAIILVNMSLQEDSKVISKEKLLQILL